MITVSLIQLKAYDISQADLALENSLRWIDKAAEGKPDLIVLPECIYPGYFLGLKGNIPEALEKLESAILSYKEKAVQLGSYIVVGLPEQKTWFSYELVENDIYNSAYMFTPKGDVFTARKSFLWHFDNKWFKGGEDYTVFDTAFGKIGMIVCADGRLPEISRILTLKGAQLIIDVTNWVTTGTNKKQLSNPQYQHMLPSRAIENKVWFVAANKVGSEAESIVYCGKSCVLNPRGEEVAVASSDQEEIITVKIDLKESNNKDINNSFDIIEMRKPQLYTPLTRPYHELPISHVLNEAVCPKDLSMFASIVQMRADINLDQYISELTRIVKMMSIQGTQMICFPEVPCTFADDAFNIIAETVQELADKWGIIIVSSTVLHEQDGKYKVSVLAQPHKEIHFYKKCHLDRKEGQIFKPGSELPVFDIPFGRLGIMMGYEGFLPEVSRVLMLQGADFIVWQRNNADTYHRQLALTRAAENKIFVAVANTYDNNAPGFSLIANPAGAAAFAFPKENQIISAQLDLVTARCKTIVPGTNVVFDRLPYAYRDLIKTR